MLYEISREMKFISDKSTIENVKYLVENRPTNRPVKGDLNSGARKID